MESTKRNSAYIRDLQYECRKIQKLQWLINPIMERNIGGLKNTALAKVRGSVTSYNITEIGTPSISGGSTKSSRKGDSNKKLTLTKDFTAGLLAIKDQSYVQSFLSQFNINS